MRFVLPIILFAGMASAQSVNQTMTRLPEESTQGIAESTDRYVPQIQHRYQMRLQLPENPLHRGVTDPDGSNNLFVGGLLDAPRGTPISRFPGITATGWNPPDPTVACGPAHLVATVNSSMAFFTKTGTKTFEVDFSTFFSSLGPGSFIFDPKVIYDVHAKRFIVAVLEEDDASATSKVLFAISDDSDPTGTWFKYRLEAKASVGSPAVPCWGDYPGLGYNKDGYAISLNMFGFSSGFEGMQIMAIKKSSVIAGGAATLTKFIDTSGEGSLQVAEGTNPSSDKIFLVASSTTTKLRVWTLGGLAGVPTTPTSQTVTVPPYEFPVGSSAPSPSGRTLDELDGRLINVVYRGTKLLTTHGVKTSTDSRNRVRWYEMSIPAAGGIATLDQSGEVKEPTGADRHFYMPAISKNAANDIALVMTKSGSASPVADIMRSARKSTDAVGAMGTPVLIKSSGGPTYGFAGSNRWGDYAAVAVDPADNGTFWVIHMTGVAGTDWITEISSFGVTPVITSITPPATVRGGGPPISVAYTTNVAPAATATVSLSSSNSSLASVPATTTLGAGLTSGSFTVTTFLGVDVNTSVTLTATLNGVAFSQSFLVRPANLLNMTLNFSTIAANQSVIGTVTLDGKAGPAGRIATLSSSAPIAVVGPTMTVLGGATTGKFGISTANTSTIKTSDITATLGVAVTRTLTVIPSPVLTSLEIAGTKTVKGGLSTSCLVRTATVAPAGGARAKLSETSAFVDPSIYANIAAGLKVGAATIHTSPVTTTQVVVITARMNGVTKTDTLTVTP